MMERRRGVEGASVLIWAPHMAETRTETMPLIVRQGAL